MAAVGALGAGVVVAAVVAAVPNGIRDAIANAASSATTGVIQSAAAAMRDWKFMNRSPEKAAEGAAAFRAYLPPATHRIIDKPIVIVVGNNVLRVTVRVYEP